jgi:hypothetical protein
VPADRLVIGFAAPALSDRDRAAYEVASEILAGGPSSRLYRTLIVDKQWASSVHADVAPTRDPGLYGVWVQMAKGHGAEQAERVIVDATTALAAQPVSAGELAKAIARLETEFWRAPVIQPRAGRGAGRVRDRGRRFPEPVRAGGRLPVGHRRRRQAGRRHVPRDRRPFGRHRAAESPLVMMGALLSATLAVGAAAPRSVPATPGALRRPGPAGSVLIVESNPTVPLVHVVVASRSGSAADPRHREGLTNLAAEWARRGAGGKSREEIDAALDGWARRWRCRRSPIRRGSREWCCRATWTPSWGCWPTSWCARTFRRQSWTHASRGDRSDRRAAERRSGPGRPLLRAQPVRRSPLRSPADGIISAVEAARPEEVSAHFRRHFVGKNLVFAFSGDVEADALAAA